MTADSTFWDRLARRYSQRPIDDPEGYRTTLARTRAHLKKTDRVLELGCGTASTALDLASDVSHITATDFSPVMIEIGVAKLRETGLTNVTLQVADANRPAPSGTDPFDAVLAFNLLHLVPDQQATLRAIHDMLPPGGLLISKTACLREKWYLGPLVRVLQWVGKAPHVLIHDMKALRAEFGVAGFEIIEEIVQAGGAPRLFIVARRR